MNTSSDHNLNSPTQAAKPRRNLLRVLLRDGVCMVLLLTVIELILQVTAPQYRQQYYDTQYTGSHKINLNDAGYRGPQIPITKTDGELRILAMGDSVTFGTGVGSDETWAAQLQANLQKAFKRPVHVLNVAVPGSSVTELQQDYLEHWRAYEPDMVICVATANMVTQQWFVDHGKTVRARELMLRAEAQSGKAGLKQQVKMAMSKLCLPSFISINSQRLLYAIGLMNHDVNPKLPLGPMVAYGWYQKDLTNGVVNEAWDGFGKAMAELKQTLKQDDVAMLSCFATPRFATWSGLRDNEKWVDRQRLTLNAAEKFQTLCDMYYIPAITLDHVLQQARKVDAQHPALFITFDYNHLDPMGHAAVAGALEEYLKPSLAQDWHPIQLGDKQTNRFRNVR